MKYNLYFFNENIVFTATNILVPANSSRSMQKCKSFQCKNIY